MTDLSTDTLQLLELARGAGALSDARRSHLKAALFAQIAAGGLAMQMGAGSLGLGKAAWFSGPVAKLVSAVALVSVAGAGVYAGVRAKTARVAASPVSVAAPAFDPRTPSSQASLPAATELAQQPAAPAAPLAAEAVASAAPQGASVSGKAVSAIGHAAASAPAVPASPSPSPSADTLADETRLLRSADQALRAGNAQRALSVLDEHAASYPRGALAPERNAERMIARCLLGQVDASAAQAYLSAHPDSAFTARIRDACAVSR